MRKSAAAAAFTLAGVLIIGPAWAATAVPAAGCDGSGVSIAWDSPGQLTVEYGSFWSFSATAPNTPLSVGPWDGSATMSDAPGGYTPSTFVNWDASNCTTYVYASTGEGRPLPAGEYTVTAEVHPTAEPTATTTTSPPARLNVVPAELTVRAAASPDPSNPRNAIVSAELTGEWAETFRTYFGTTTSETAPYTPAGSWSIRVRSSDGTVVHEATASRTSDDDILGFSSFWADAREGEYTVTASFAPTGASAANFAITESAPVTLTVVGPAPGEGPTASPAPSAPPSIESTGVTLPLWIPLAAGILTAGLLAFATVQLVRTLRRRPGKAPITGEVPT